MDLVRSFTYIFEDDDWVAKVVLVAVISLIPIVNLAVIGWVIALIANVIDGVEKPMPSWDNFGQKFTDGLIYAAASFLYSIILIGVICVIGAAASISMTNSRMESEFALAFCGLGIFATIYVVIAHAALFIGLINYTREGSMAAYLRVGDNLRLAQKHAGTLLMLALMLFAAGLVIGLVAWVPCIGWLLTITLSTPVMAHLAGQAGAQIYRGSLSF